MTPFCIFLVNMEEEQEELRTPTPNDPGSSSPNNIRVQRNNNLEDVINAIEDQTGAVVSTIGSGGVVVYDRRNHDMLGLNYTNRLFSVVVNALEEVARRRAAELSENRRREGKKRVSPKKADKIGNVILFKAVCSDGCVYPGKNWQEFLAWEPFDVVEEEEPDVLEHDDGPGNAHNLNNAPNFDNA
ncbi:hypothetical protein Mgra_00010178 [Meloidogyne graminicola]|uniref:Uncharacterized protein n=1 Tax=Meloidogyne graminicola TaxID=189291 RepID=A0A8S9Z5X3_9BILA|nr:hypothetical protein Mgra_00010178 [Meloidogyne graminicola]